MTSIRKRKKLKKHLAEKRGAGYEKLVTSLFSFLLPEQIVQHDEKIPEKKGGTLRQIDVLISGVKTIIECKDHKKTKVSIGEMGEFADKCRSTGSKGIFVSLKGFQKGAITKAKNNNIKIYTVNEVNNSTFESNFKEAVVFSDNFAFKLVEFRVRFNESGEINLTPDDFFYSEDKQPICKIGEQISVIENQRRMEIQLSLFKEMESGKTDMYDKNYTVKEKGTLTENTYFKFNDVFYKVTSIELEMQFKLTRQELNKQYFLKADLNNKIDTEVLRASFNYQNQPYRMDLVSDIQSGKFESFLVPGTNDSKIIKLKNLGQVVFNDNGTIEIITNSNE